MVVCTQCDEAMLDIKTITCEGNNVIKFEGGEKYRPLPYVGELHTRCHDCNVKRGGNHHPGCDMERCPKCGGQLISCECAI